MRTQIKGAAVPKMEGVENYITTIDRGGYFEVTSFSEDDLKRNEMYKKTRCARPKWPLSSITATTCAALTCTP